MINIRFCKECEQTYDIGTNFDICPDCKNKKGDENDK